MSNTTTFDAMMAEGHGAMQAGHDDKALQRFTMAGTHTEDAAQRSSAMQMCCVVLNKLGRITESIEFGDAALKLAIESGDNTQVAHCKRDLGAAHHKQAIRLALRRERDPEYEREPKFSRRHFMTAHRHFKEAERYFGRQREVAATVGNPVGMVRYGTYAALTRGMHGLLYVDMDVYCSLSHGDKSKGRRMIREADNTLRGYDASLVWQANNLIKLMRVSNLGTRLRLLGRALALTGPKSESPGSRAKVLTALAGNSFCNWAMLRNLEVTDAEMQGYEQKLQMAV